MTTKAQFIAGNPVELSVSGFKWEKNREGEVFVYFFDEEEKQKEPYILLGDFFEENDVEVVIHVSMKKFGINDDTICGRIKIPKEKILSISAPEEKKGLTSQNFGSVYKLN